MTSKHVQAELAPDEYSALADAARQEGLSIKQALREAAVAWAHRKHKDPLFAIIGIAKGRADASRKVDEIYDED